MLCRELNVVPRVSSDARGLCGLCLLWLLPLFGWFGLQGLDEARLTAETWTAGNWHALWTGHLLHYTLEHYLWDALMFVVFAGLLWREERWRLWLWLFHTAPFISFWVFAVEPQITEYRGLSALDTMLFTRFCLGVSVSNQGWDRWLFGWLPLAGLFSKIIYELTTGSAIFVADLGEGVVPLPSAHLAGLVVGVMWFLLTINPSSKKRA